MQSNRVHGDWASENLQVIRTLMERATLYRRTLAPVTLATGAVGVAAGLLGWWGGFETARRFALFWMFTALVTLGAALLVMRRQALRDGEPFWSPPTRRVALAIWPSLFAGLVAGLVMVIPSWREPLHAWWLPGTWMVLYGCGVHAAGFFMPRGMKLFGWIFAGVGAILLLVVNERSHASGMPPLRLAHLVMGGLFGGLHLAYGLYLGLTERRSHAT